MAIAEHIYLFDANNFQKMFVPIVQRLVSGDTTLLEETANQIATNNQNVWTILKNYRYYPSDLGREGEEFCDSSSRIDFWTMIVLAFFLQPIEYSRWHIQTLSDILRNLRWTEIEARKLTEGRSQKELLPSNLSKKSTKNLEINEAWSVEDWLNNVALSISWYSASDVRKIKFSLSQNNMQKKIGEEKFDAYKAIVSILSVAESENAGLLLTVSD